MKIAFGSDIHLEFEGADNHLELYNEEEADILVLAGDICVARDIGPQNVVDEHGKIIDSYYLAAHGTIMNFFEQASAAFPQVLYIMGNHEHYHGDFSFTINKIRHALEKFKNVHVLDKQAYRLKDTVFLAGTMWTNMNNNDPIIIYHVEGMMNDFRCVYYSDKPGKFLPEDAYKDHLDFIAFVEAYFKHYPQDDKVVIVTHHAPSFESINPQYRNVGSYMMNCAYASNLENLILDNPRIKKWIHGHMHHPFDYDIGDTKILCNPRGYIGHQPLADQFKLKYIEV